GPNRESIVAPVVLGLLQVVIVEIGVDTENDTIAQVEVVAGIDTAEEAVRLELRIATPVAVQLVATPAPADFATDIGTAPRKHRRCERNGFLRHDRVRCKGTAVGGNCDKGCAKNDFKIHGKIL